MSKINEDWNQAYYHHVALNLFQGRTGERLCDAARIGHLSRKTSFRKE